MFISFHHSGLSSYEQERSAWDKRCLPIQMDEFVSVQEKYHFTFVDRKMNKRGSMKVLKRRAYSHGEDGNDDEEKNDDNKKRAGGRRHGDRLLKKHSMFFVENTMRDLQDYQLRMRGLLMKMY